MAYLLMKAPMTTLVASYLGIGTITGTGAYFFNRRQIRKHPQGKILFEKTPQGIKIVNVLSSLGVGLCWPKYWVQSIKGRFASGNGWSQPFLIDYDRLNIDYRKTENGGYYLQWSYGYGPLLKTHRKLETSTDTSTRTTNTFDSSSL